MFYNQPNLFQTLSLIGATLDRTVVLNISFIKALEEKIQQQKK
jgi:hypothetical protein